MTERGSVVEEDGRFSTWPFLRRHTPPVTTLADRSVRGVGAEEPHAEARAAGKVTERAGEEGLADADGPEDDDVAMSGHEAERAELLEHMSGLMFGGGVVTRPRAT